MSRHHFIRILGFVLASILFPASAFACEEYRSFGAAELKELRDKLIDAEADPLDRLFAFEELVCSDNPTLRSFAVREGLRTSSDPLLRHQILLEAMLMKQRLDIVLSPSSNASQSERDFVKQHAGVYSENLRFRSRSKGCMSTYSHETCDQHLVTISGDLVQLTQGNLTAEFRLSTDNKLVGFLKPRASDKIPALIELF